MTIKSDDIKNPPKPRSLYDVLNRVGHEEKSKLDEIEAQNLAERSNKTYKWFTKLINDAGILPIDPMSFGVNDDYILLRLLSKGYMVKIYKANHPARLWDIKVVSTCRECNREIYTNYLNDNKFDSKITLGKIGAGVIDAVSKAEDHTCQPDVPKFEQGQINKIDVELVKAIRNIITEIVDGTLPEGFE